MHIKIGDYDCYALSDGSFKLDGGSLCGVIPKTEWSALYAVDEHNRIAIGLNALLVVGNGIVLLMEGGIGTALDTENRLKETYFVSECNQLDAAICRAGIDPHDISIATYSHLHWDHAGNACNFKNGSFVPRYPKARYIVQQGEWDNMFLPIHQDSYLPDTLTPLVAAKQLCIINGDCTVHPGITLIKTGGHTRDHMILTIKSGGQGLIYYGDLVPTKQHAHIPYISAYDNYPLDTLTIKSQLLRMAVAEKLYCLCPHDLAPQFGKIEFDGVRYSFVV